MFALLNTTFKKEIVALEKLSKKMNKIEQKKKTVWRHAENIFKDCLSEIAADLACLLKS